MVRRRRLSFYSLSFTFFPWTYLLLLFRDGGPTPAVVAGGRVVLVGAFVPGGRPPP